MSKPVVRGFIAEWAVTIVILLFGTTTVLQAFVIPSGSMEGTLLVGDHLIVDKLVYSPPDAVSKHVLPCRDVQRGDVIVFRYPPGLEKNLVKRAIGVPGDRIRLENKRLVLNGIATDEPYARHLEGSDPYRDNLLVFRRARLGHGRDYLRTRLNASSANSESELMRCRDAKPQPCGAQRHGREQNRGYADPHLAQPPGRQRCAHLVVEDHRYDRRL